MSARQPMIFCDFDGTVTDSDNIIAIMKKYAPPEWNELKDKVLSQEISIREGVGKMFSLLPSSQKKELTAFILEHAALRKGFHEFVEYTTDQQIPLYIVSGGIDFFVEPLLEGLVPANHIYCNGSDFSDEFIEINWPHSCDEECKNDCGCCKPSVMRKLADKGAYKIVVGDSITDLQAAKMADCVIARDFLIEKCEEDSIAYEAFEDFFDVIKILKKQEVPS